MAKGDEVVAFTIEVSFQCRNLNQITPAEDGGDMDNGLTSSPVVSVHILRGLHGHQSQRGSPGSGQ